MNDLAGKVAIITGGGYGIGKVIARAFGAAKMKLVLAARSPGPLEEARRELAEAGAAVVALPTDVAREEQCARMVRTAVESFGRLDVLVNNAGIAGPTKPITETTLAEWQETLDVNITGAWLCAREAIRAMAAAGRGNILNISSAAGRRGYPLRSPYSASKWALIGLTQTLAAEGGRHGIRVNCICPGPVEGDRIERVIRARAASTGTPHEQVRQWFVGDSPLQRMVTEDEVARVALFLVSEASAGMTGQTLNVDGGKIMT
ncbi:MAG: SDR family oxidoreductase [Deltaproteobacteria bacterium]|jgi:NAD(P)-dependent dehydrogenase (short-subunit alcohol dehydrogenase family)|nr:SDR family oxidoreductase [Deltaproteobacteria bacterium]